MEVCPNDSAYFKPMVFDRVEYIEKNIVEVLTES